jgi:hypothetical protein
MQETLRGGGGKALQCQCQYKFQKLNRIKEINILDRCYNLFDMQRHLSLAYLSHFAITGNQF